MQSSEATTRSAPLATAWPWAWRSFATLPAMSPTMGLSCAMAMDRRSGITISGASGPCPYVIAKIRISRLCRPCAAGQPRRAFLASGLAQQEFAPDLHQRLAVISDDIGGGVGLRPDVRQVGAGAHHVQRRLGLGHHAALGRGETGAADDLHLV